MICYDILVGGWPTPLKNMSMSSSVGMMTFPTEWTNKTWSKPPSSGFLHQRSKLSVVWQFDLPSILRIVRIGGNRNANVLFFLAGTGEPKRHHSRNPSMAKWLQYSTLGLWDVSGTLALPATTAWTADAAWVELGCAERIPRVGEQLPFETKRCSWLITAESCWNPNFDMLKSSRSIRMMTGWAARNLWYAITEGTKCWASKLERHHQVFHISPVSRALLAAWCSRSEACFWSKIRPQNLRVKP